MTIAALGWPEASIYIALIAAVALVAAVELLGSAERSIWPHLVDLPNGSDRDRTRQSQARAERPPPHMNAGEA